MTPYQIVERLQNLGYEAYFIGGYVRDSILNKKTKDIDIVTNATPEKIVAFFVDCKIKEVGKSFGVVLVDNIEVTTYRKDKYFGLSDKNVEIEFSNSLREDMERRDLTINSIAINPITGEIIDYCNGINDLKEKIIRFVGNPEDRIFEDPNRIIRACRFKALINGNFDASSYKALKNCAHFVKHISSERIRKEILKTMSTVPKASNFFVACFKIGILKYIFQSLEDCIGIAQNKFHSEDVFTHSIFAGDSISCKYPLLKLATYLHDIGKPQVKEFNSEKQDYTFLRHEDIGAGIIKKELTDLAFSNNEVDFITSLIENHMSFQLSTPKATRKTLRRINGKITICEMLRFKIADRKAKFLNGVNSPLEISQIKDMIGKIEDVLIKKEPFNLKDLAIDGFDIMNTLKIKPGPIVGALLEKLFEKVLEDPELNTKEKLLDLLLDEIPY